MDLKLVLNEIINGISFEELPEEWKVYTLSSFSNDKQLFDYQTSALKSTLISLYLYFQAAEDYAPEEATLNINKRKRKLYNTYSNLFSDIKNLDIKPLKRNEYLFEIYRDQFKPNDKGIISFENMVNRLSLWMATGSGKTLVIVKLFEIINILIERNEIPNNNILFLAPKDKIINQTIELAKEYSMYYKNKFIRFVSLKDYEKDKKDLRLTGSDEITVYYYRSDNISDTSGEALVNYKDYLNDGQWYIILDEAHKGNKESSKRQAYYSLMTTKGFLFNLSATFTDPVDFITNAYNFNLEKFIMDGYGKNIYVSDAEFNFSQGKEDNINLEKQKIVLKSLITLTASKLASKKIKSIQSDLYHSPLGVTITNTVTKENSDLHLYFNELKKFAENDFSQNLFDDAKSELISEFKRNKKYAFDIDIENFNIEIIKSINPKNVLLEVFNSENYSGIEYLDSKDQKEIGLRLKGSTVSSPFALIKIGDISEWKNSILNGYSYTGTFEVKNYFDNLNQNNDINILLGSRAFYEGWDSPRPNVLNFINIGTSDARKFVLQAIGRGIRLEPVRNFRKRLKYLYFENRIEDSKYNSLIKFNTLVESLFVFATDKEMISEILTTLDDQKTPGQNKEIKLLKSKSEHKLLVPIYKEIKKDYSKMPKFHISIEAFNRLKSYLHSTPVNVIMLQFFLTLEEIQIVKQYLENKSNIVLDENYAYKDLTLAFQKLTAYLRSNDKEFDGFKQIDDEIIHYLNVMVSEDDYPHIQKEVLKVIKFVELSNTNPKKLMEQLMEGKVAARTNYKDLEIKYIAQHYYNPLITSNDEKVDYINHIIKVDSEVSFVKKLETFLSENKEVINEKYDWWLFSKVDESLDKIYIPYYDQNNIRKFNPDFIFWMQKDDNYRIVFVDPKGTSSASFINKVGGYERFFKEKEFEQNEVKITIDLVLFNEENPFTDNHYSSYWKSEVEDIF